MSSPERSDMEAYQDVLQEMAERLEVADGFLAGVGTKFDLESAALQLRLELELMVLGSLITNREAISSVFLLSSSSRMSPTRRGQLPERRIPTTGRERLSTATRRTASSRSPRPPKL